MVGQSSTAAQELYIILHLAVRNDNFEPFDFGFNVSLCESWNVVSVGISIITQRTSSIPASPIMRHQDIITGVAL